MSASIIYFLLFGKTLEIRGKATAIENISNLLHRTTPKALVCTQIDNKN
jgi:cation transport ATPase